MVGFDIYEPLAQLDDHIRTSGYTDERGRSIGAWWGEAGLENQLKLAGLLARGHRTGPAAMAAAWQAMSDPGVVVKGVATGMQVRDALGKLRPKQDRNFDGKLDVEIPLPGGRVGVDLDADGDIDIIESEVMGYGQPRPLVGLGTDEDEYYDDSDHWS
jgi:hypothetical protein